MAVTFCTAKTVRVVQRKLLMYCYSTSCSIMYANKACFVRSECDTRSIEQAHTRPNVLDYH